MSYKCTNSTCPNHTAQLPQEAAERFDYKCFLCDGVLQEPPLTLDLLLSQVDILPVALQILPRLQALLNDDNSSLDDIASTTRTDASLVSRLIHVANGAYFALAHGGTCTSVEQALTRIGLNKAYSVVGYVAAKEVYCKFLTLYGITGQQLWQDSVRTAYSMQVLTPQIFVFSDSYKPPDTGTAYTAGLLWQIGKMVLSQFHQSGGTNAFKQASVPLTQEIENEILGFSHLDVTTALMEKWSFSHEMLSPIKYKDHPLRCPDDRPFACLLSLVIAAVDAFPITKDEIDFDEMSHGFSPDSETLALTGISKVDFLEAICSSMQFVKKGSVVGRLK
jgi:HD-like signal output (HDOD) protein